MHHRLAFIGFGTVGQGLAEILVEKKEHLRQEHDATFSVVAISDVNKGAAYHPDGLSLERILGQLRETGRIDGDADVASGWDSLKTISRCGADIMVEVSYTDIKTGEPAISHVRSALERGIHVVTSNKGPVALAGRELADLADRKDVLFRYEGTVMSGTPTISLAREHLAGAQILQVRGIVNGTTNYILSEMEKGQGYAPTLKKAQQLGYAEAVPDADVRGWDALAKIVIMANMLMGGHLQVSDVPCEGITDISPEDISAARRESARWKLIARAWREEEGRVRAKVSPEKVPLTDFLASVDGVTNAVTFDTDLLGSVTIVGPGAGRRETGFALLADILAIHRHLAPGRKRSA